MKANQCNSIEEAKRYAFLLLKFRLRSEAEMRNRLLLKKFSSAIVEQTVDFLKNKRFLDDQAFAKAWIQFRLKKPLGVRRILKELLLKGIAKSIAQEQIRSIAGNIDERQIILMLAKNRKASPGLDPIKHKRRLFGYLIRKGFNPDLVHEVVERL